MAFLFGLRTVEMKDGFPGDVPAQELRRSRQSRPFFRSAILTCLLLAGVTVIAVMVFFPKQLWLLSPVLTGLVGCTTAHPVQSEAHFDTTSSLQHASADHNSLDQLGAVASESSICSIIGRDLLLQGGNAADAMVGTTFCVGVMGMYHSGIGGGGFALVRGADGEYEYIDFRETAPAAAFQDMYKDNANGSVFGGLASGIPGEVAGLAHLHTNYGKLPWKNVMQGAIKTARYGFPVTADLVRYMGAATASEEESFLVNDPNWAQDFAPNGTLVQLGDTITRKRYANTLETIANKGASEFYTGQMAHAMVAAVQKENGTMTLDDLKHYTVAIRPHAKTTYRGYNLHSVSAPASGTVALSILKILEGYPDIGSPEALNLSTHRLDEAIRFGYGQRTEMGDPDFVEGMDEYEANMLNASTAAYIRSKISDDKTFNVSHYNPSGAGVLETPGTSHVVTADNTGLAISLTTTINLLFGSRVLVPETGVIMNNEMDDFSIPGLKNAFGFVPSPSNYIRAGKRPASSITCTIVENSDGSLYFVTGAAGGSRIITATLQTLWGVLDRNMTAAESLAMPRLHDQLTPDTVAFEYGYDNSTVDFMRDRGHNVTYMGTGWSSAQCLRLLDNGTFEAASEPRQLASGGFVV